VFVVLDWTASLPKEEAQFARLNQFIGGSFMQEHSTPSGGEKTVETDSALPLAGAWRRYAALYVDFAVVGVPLVLLLAAVGGLDFAGGALLVTALIPPILTFLILGLCAVAFAVFGNTPGKALFSLHVVTVTGTRPTSCRILRPDHRRLL